MVGAVTVPNLRTHTFNSLWGPWLLSQGVRETNYLTLNNLKIYHFCLLRSNGIYCDCFSSLFVIEFIGFIVKHFEMCCMNTFLLIMIINSSSSFDKFMPEWIFSGTLFQWKVSVFPPDFGCRSSVDREPRCFLLSSKGRIKLTSSSKLYLKDEMSAKTFFRPSSLMLTRHISVW